MQMIQQLQGALEGKQMELQQQGQVEQMKLISAERIKDKQLQVDYVRIRAICRGRVGGRKTTPQSHLHWAMRKALSPECLD
jgi:hypothetical protein